MKESQKVKSNSRILDIENPVVSVRKSVARIKSNIRESIINPLEGEKKETFD